MKTVNLEEIVISEFDRFGNFSNIEDVITGMYDDPASSKDIFLMAMKTACNKAIELAAENARIERVYPDLHPSFEIVNKQSILNTKSQII